MARDDRHAMMVELENDIAALSEAVGVLRRSAAYNTPQYHTIVRELLHAQIALQQLQREDYVEHMLHDAGMGQ